MNYGKNKIDSYEKGIDREFAMTNSRGCYLATTIIGTNTKPYHGLFVKTKVDKNAGCINPNTAKVLVSNILDTVKIGDNEYKLYTLNQKDKRENNMDYLKKFSKSYIPTFEYRVGKVYICKKMTIVHKEEILYLEYLIENREDRDIRFRIEPLLTYRGLYSMRKEKDIPFSKREVKNGVRVNLSIDKNDTIIIKTKDAKYKPEARYIKDVVTRSEGKNYIEDLYSPGQFDVKVKAFSTQTVRIILSTIDMPVDNIEKTEYFKMEEERLDRFLYGIRDYKKEVKSLALSVHELETRNMKSLRKSLLPSIPFQNDDISSIFRSIEGTFLIPKKAYQARELLRSIPKYMKDGVIVKTLSNKPITDSRKKLEAAFFYVEAINVYMKYAENYDLDKVYFLPIIKDIIYSVLDEKNEDSYFFDDYIIGVKNGATYDKFVDINILWYNTLKIYLEIKNEKDVVHDKLLRIANMTRQAIIDNFYSKEEKVFRYNIYDEYKDAKIEMIYALSLSYPVLYREYAKPFLKKVYKEYYTDLGMRKNMKNSKYYDGYVYPEYMAYFMKAMYREELLATITGKSKDLLVKPILDEVDKSCIGALPERYNESTGADDGCLMFGETMSEILRIYDMLK